MVFKKSQSQVIATVLLILLVIVSISIIMAFVIPFVIDILPNEECIDFGGNIEITNSITYSCYDNVNDVMNVQVHLGDVEIKRSGFKIVLDISGSSQSYEFNNGEIVPGIELYNGTTKLNIPEANEERTYKITAVNTKPSAVRIKPLLEDCEEGYFAELNIVKECI